MAERDAAAVRVDVARSQRSSRPASRRNWRTTDANASLTSITAMSSQLSPAFVERALARLAGCRAASGTGRRPRGRTRRTARAARARAAQAAASLATQHRGRAVDDRARVPGGDDAVRLERGLRATRASRATCRARGVSSTANEDDRAARRRPRPARSRSRSCPRRSPRPRAGATRASTRRAPRGESSHSSAITSAEMPCGTIGQRSPIFSLTAPQPSSPRFEPIGTRDIVLDARRDDDVEVPGLDGGRRVERGLHRGAALPVDGRRADGLGPAGDEHGATARRSAPARRPGSRSPSARPRSRRGRGRRAPTRPFRTCAASSSARISASEPFRRPIGERTASTTYAASGMPTSIERPRLGTTSAPSTLTPWRRPRSSGSSSSAASGSRPATGSRCARPYSGERRRARREGRRRRDAARGRRGRAGDARAAAGAQARRDPRPRRRRARPSAHEEVARTISAEAGKPMKAARVEAARAMSTFTLAAVEARKLAGEMVPMDASQAGAGKLAFTLRLPDRRRRRDLAVQLPAQPRRAQGRAGARGGLRGRAEAGVADAALGAAPRRARGRRRACRPAG